VARVEAHLGAVGEVPAEGGLVVEVADVAARAVCDLAPLVGGRGATQPRLDQLGARMTPKTWPAWKRTSAPWVRPRMKVGWLSRLPT